MVLFCFEADSVLFVLLSSPLVGKFLVLPLVSMRCVLRNNMEPQGEVSSMHNTIKGEAGGKCNKRNQSASHVSVQVVYIFCSVAFFSVLPLLSTLWLLHALLYLFSSPTPLASHLFPLVLRCK